MKERLRNSSKQQQAQAQDFQDTKANQPGPAQRGKLKMRNTEECVGDKAS